MTNNHDSKVTRLVASLPTGAYIGGCFTESSNGSRLAVHDPANGEVVTTVADGTTQDVTQAVDAAFDALPRFAASSPRQRSQLLGRAFELVMEHLEELSRVIVIENGKTLADARSEVVYAAEFLRWYAEEAVRNRGEVAMAPSGDNRIMVLPQPIGVAALITPWNFPAAMLTRKIGPALAAGCTIVCKPAEETPLTALYLARLFERAGVPKGVVNVVPSTRPAEVAKTLLADKRVRKLSFTGSTEVGRSLLRLASENVVDCSMELGGNAPFIVFRDADLEQAVSGAMVAKMRNGGEACTAANRFYVQAEVADAFTKLFTERMAALKIGPGLEEGVEVGPLINAPSRAKVAGLVDEALEQGADALLGAKVPDGPGYYYPPTVLAGVEPDSAVLDKEIFGPVAPIVTFGSESEAIEMANDTDYGLVSYAFTRDYRRALRVAEALESGMVGLNRGTVSDPAAPFGGVKQSGLGREGGREGMLEYQEAKYISVSW